MNKRLKIIFYLIINYMINMKM